MDTNIYRDGIMGLVVGDALGNPVQFMSRSAVADRPQGPVTSMEGGGVFSTPVGAWTDDGSMTLATLYSIIEKNGIDPEDIMNNFAKWYFDDEFTSFGEAFDMGNTCGNAIYAHVNNQKKGGKFDYFGATGEYANGNGALMRILPVCLYYIDRASSVCTSDDQAIEAIHNVTALTHNTLRTKMANGLYYFMAKNIVNMKENESVRDCLQRGLDEGFAYYGHDIRNLTEKVHFARMTKLDEFAKVPENEIKSSGYVIHTFEAAVWCLINTNSYEECLLKAVNLGDDADTVGAVAGGLAGLYYGYKNIPEEWLEALQRREWIEAMCEV